MTPPQKTAWFDLLLITLFSLPIISPLWQNTIPQSADGLLHLYRVIALDAAWQQGAWFPRWWPDLAYGYGLPLFVYYAPLSYYLTKFIHLLGFDFITSFNLSFMIAIWLGGVGMYLFARDPHGHEAGLMASVAYMYAPYPLLTAFWRGSLPIVWAWAVIPWAFWAVSRLMRRGQARDLPLAALCVGLALLMHNISNLLFFPTLCLYVLSGYVSFRSPRQYLIYPFLALTWGLALAAFFLAPALTEQSFVQIHRVITPPDFDYHFNFLSFKDIFSLPQPTNTGLLNPNYAPALGWPQLILALLSLISLAPKPTAYFSLLLPGFMLCLAVFMTLPISVTVWDSFPMLAFMQQPQRFLSLAAFLLALFVGARPYNFTQPVDKGAIFIGLTGLYLAAIPLLYPRYYAPLPAELTIQGMWHYEQQIGALGTTSFGEYLPNTVQQIPRNVPTHIDAGRLDLAYLPPHSTAKLISALEWHITSPEPYQAVWHIFYFPGWQATIDGQPVPVTPFSEQGLISLPISAGEHQVKLFFRDTPLRQAANTVSFLAWLGLVVMGAWHIKPGVWLKPTSFPLTPYFWPLFAYALALIFIKLLYFDNYDTPLKQQFVDHKVTAAETKLQVNFGNQLNLLGYRLNSTMMKAGDNFDLIAYWQAQQPLITNYSILLHLVDKDHNLYAGQDNLHPGNFPTTRWDINGFVQDPHTLHVPPGTPPGHYFLVIGPYQPATWQRLAVLAGGDEAWGDVFPLAVQITKPTTQPTLAELNITWPHEIQVGPDLLFLGTTPERDTIKRNDFLRLALFWEALHKPNQDYQINLRIVSQSGQLMANHVARPSYNHYSTLQWQVGERVRDNQAIWIPADWAAGVYHIELYLLAATGQPLTEGVILGSLAIE